MENILISIAMCTYNGEKFLKEQIDSILKQSYKNFELIITDDGSTDKTLEIINNYQKKDDRIKVFQNKENLGYVKNFEKAIILSTGDYIALADQDDVWKTDKLEKLLSILEGNDSLLVYSDALLVDDNLISQNKTLIESLNITPIKDNNYLFFMFQNTVSGNTLLFRSILKDKVLPFPNEISFHDIWIAFVASTMAPIQFTDEALVYYRRHENNVTSLTKKKTSKTYEVKMKRKLDSFEKKLKSIAILVKYLENNKIDQEDAYIMKDIYYELSKYQQYYFNYRLYKLLLDNKEKLFFFKKKVSILNILKMSLGYKTYRVLPFI